MRGKSSRWGDLRVWHIDINITIKGTNIGGITQHFEWRTKMDIDGIRWTITMAIHGIKGSRNMNIHVIKEVTNIAIHGRKKLNAKNKNAIRVA